MFTSYWLDKKSVLSNDKTLMFIFGFGVVLVSWDKEVAIINSN